MKTDVCIDIKDLENVFDLCRWIWIRIFWCVLEMYIWIFDVRIGTYKNVRIQYIVRFKNRLSIENICFCFILSGVIILVQLTNQKYFIIFACFSMQWAKNIHQINYMELIDGNWMWVKHKLILQFHEGCNKSFGFVYNVFLHLFVLKKEENVWGRTYILWNIQHRTTYVNIAI